MTNTLTILRLAGGLAEHSATRQSLIAQNIAHADTPGYQARDLMPFSQVARDPNASFQAYRTRDGHTSTAVDAGGRFEARQMWTPGSESPNGNTVALEDQMIRATQARQSHEMALTIYRKSLDMLRAGLGRTGG